MAHGLLDVLVSKEVQARNTVVESATKSPLDHNFVRAIRGKKFCQFVVVCVHFVILYMLRSRCCLLAVSCAAGRDKSFDLPKDYN